jgi:hypothetical protein
MATSTLKVGRLLESDVSLCHQIVSGANPAVLEMKNEG